MKHLRKYNESNIEYIDYEYMNVIFANFIDKGAQSDYNAVKATEYMIEMDSETPCNNNIDGYLEYNKKVQEELLEIKSCIDKVKDEYPTIKVHFFYDDGYGETGGPGSFTKNKPPFYILNFAMPKVKKKIRFDYGD